MKSKLAFSLLLVLSVACSNLDVSIVISHPEFTAGIEGPAVNSSGVLYVVNFQQEGTIGFKMPEDTSFRLCVKLPEGSVGNGIRFKNDSICYVADYPLHQILEVNVNQRTVGVFAHENQMNQPNDLAIGANGVLYASDPNWKEGSGQLWRVLSNGKVELLERDMGTTNGVEVSPDDEFLYVNESIQRKVWRYRITRDGVAEKTLFYEFVDGGLDGMRCDQMGNLYIARYDKSEVAVLSPDAELVRTIHLHGEKPTNVAFGGKDGKTVFVTLQDKKWVEAFKTDVPGRSFGLEVRQ